MVQHMIANAPNQAVEVILLLLRYAGARISEILGMTAGGYRKCPEPYAAMVRNKGGHGKEIKAITFPPGVAQKLHAYIANERAQNDAQHRTRIEELRDIEPIFLNRNGKGYTYECFRYYWVNVLLPQAQQHVAPIHFTPHDIRHLLVSELMDRADIALERGIATSAEDYEDTIRLAMGWADEETMSTYNHAVRKRESLGTIHAVQCAIETDSERLTQPGHSPSPAPPSNEQGCDEGDDDGLALWRALTQ
jgi:integrase